MRRKVAIVALTVAGLGVGGLGLGSAGADPTNLNRVCTDRYLQELVAEYLFVEANHGQCEKALSGVYGRFLDCRDPRLQERLAGSRGVPANYGQCKLALEDVFVVNAGG